MNWSEPLSNSWRYNRQVLLYLALKTHIKKALTTLALANQFCHFWPISVSFLSVWMRLLTKVISQAAGREKISADLKFVHFTVHYSNELLYSCFAITFWFSSFQKKKWNSSTLTARLPLYGSNVTNIDNVDVIHPSFFPLQCCLCEWAVI